MPHSLLQLAGKVSLLEAAVLNLLPKDGPFKSDGSEMLLTSVLLHKACRRQNGCR